VSRVQAPAPLDFFGLGNANPVEKQEESAPKKRKLNAKATEGWRVISLFLYF
jgi:hypothetical protein